MQKNTKYWLINTCCVAIVAGFIIGTQNKSTSNLSGQLSQSSNACTELVGYWKFDAGTGTSVTDYSGNTNVLDFSNLGQQAWSDTTPNEITFWNTGSIDLPGTGYLWVQTGSSLKLTGDYTISLWAKADVLSSAEVGNFLVSYGGRTAETLSEKDDDNYIYALSINGANKKLRLMWENGSSATDVIVESSIASGITPNTWNHIVVTKNATSKEIEFYMNGTNLGVTQDFTLVPSGSSGAASFYIGVGPHNPSATFFNGMIDDVRIYQKVLTESDVGSLYSGDDSLAGCTCGNNEIEPPEACDDGNSNNDDECTNICTLPVCGDGYIQPSLGEQCDPPGTATCSDACKSIGTASSASSIERVIPPNCGNRIVNENEGEECDDGHLNGSGECSEYCTILYCGDGILSPEIDEECEPTPSSYVNGEPIFIEPTCGDVCAIPTEDSEGCTRLFLPPCETVQRNQLGTTSSSSIAEQTSSTEESICGNGVVEVDEECDNGSVCSNDITASCISSDDCAESARCIYNYDADEACTNACTLVNEVTTSVSSVASSVETTVSSTNSVVVQTASSVAAATTSAVCGNFTVEGTEECDEGMLNSNTEPNACRTDCTNPVCGDGVLDAKEECDDGVNNSNTQPNACRTSCKLPVCGDKVRDEGEECDGGITCKKDCTLPSLSVCGNGVVEGSEKCDDGNIWPGDGCNSLCMPEIASSSSIASSTIVASSYSSSSQASGVVAGEQTVITQTRSSKASSVQSIPVAVASSTSAYSIFTLQPIQAVAVQATTASVIQQPTHSPVGDTGPAAILVVVGGATSGILWKRRKKQ